MSSNRNIPNLATWLLAQWGRNDEVGTLARLWLIEEKDCKRPFSQWLDERRKGLVFAESIKTAEHEFDIACKLLKNEEFCPTFLSGQTLPNREEFREASRNRHHDSPNIDPRLYLEALREVLFEHSIKERKVVYLDTNYWIGLRNIYLDSGDSDERFRPLFATLVELVKEKKIICPISCPIFCELLKQTDSKTRKATAELMTLLSEGVSLRCLDELVLYEARKESAKLLGFNLPDACEVWTKSHFVFGEGIPFNGSFTSKQNSWLSRIVIDELWTQPFVEMVISIDPSIDWPNWKATVEAHNTDFIQLREANLKRRDLRNHEVAVALNFWGYWEKVIDTARIHWEQDQETCISAMNSNKNQKPDPQIAAPFQIMGGINAVYVNSGKKRIKENDVYDSLHAAFSLPYCDVFAGDRGICHAITENQNSFDKVYGVSVCRNAAELQKLLEGSKIR